jgi:hypothetical protein
MANNTLIIGHAFVIHDAFDHFAPQLDLVGLVGNQTTVWSPFGLPIGFSPPMGFYTPSSILQKALDDHVRHIEAFSRLKDV